jgi:4,5-DOPA dioxygenase extradiol
VRSETPVYPNAVLVISAHWTTQGICVATNTKPRTIHDYSGFPPELSQVEYPAPGSPALAQHVINLLREFTAPEPICATTNWGLDHGTWSVLCHVFPEADVPVVQLSINTHLSAHDHVEIGRSLAPLLAEDVMVVGSGNIVHNLGVVDWGSVGKGAVWAEEFDAEARRILTGENPSDIVSLLDHPHARKAVPTAEHFLPIAYIAGIAEASGKSLDVLVGGCELGSLSMTSYVLS